ncbi:hypothetical protein CEY16_03175 [Halalkalibacillus sediminis]|uniref:SCP domain-containing protein n=2 Tax=Halalkalibacillus sediminis TaxID=2018042 RepID=A0A2I0QYH6_9BACI|nr:hypothetical protein CEY16_03175 [Halalkalibacillus sediminis]
MSKDFSDYVVNENYTHVGVGYEEGGEYGHYWTVYFIEHQPEENIQSFEKEVFHLVNERREEHGLEPLKYDFELANVAREKSRDMRDSEYFAHESPNYGPPHEMINQFDIPNSGSAENIAAGQRTPEEVMEGWMNSDGHRANILHEDLTHIGVGYTQGGPYRTYWTQMFVRR